MPERGESLQVALGRVIRDVELRTRLETDADAVLAELGLSPEDRRGMLSAGASRLIAYHEMVHARLRGTIRTFIGRAASVLGESALHEEVDAFIAHHGPTTPYLRDVPDEFLAWARPRWQDGERAPWLGDLAAIEVLQRQVRNDPREVGAALDTPIDLERPIVSNATTELVRYRYGVQHLPRKLAADSEPTLAPGEGYWVIVYRHPDDTVRFVDIKERSAHLLRLLLEGETLRSALFGACAATGEVLDDEILGVTALTLADLVDRHVLLGGGEALVLWVTCRLAKLELKACISHVAHAPVGEGIPRLLDLPSHYCPVANGIAGSDCDDMVDRAECPLSAADG